MLDFRKNSINSALRKVLKRLHYPLEVMLTCVRWYVAYPLSLRYIEEMMRERGIFVDHATVHRWTIKMVPVLAPPYFVGASTPLAKPCPQHSSSTAWLFDHQVSDATLFGQNPLMRQNQCGLCVQATLNLSGLNRPGAIQLFPVADKSLTIGQQKCSAFFRDHHGRGIRVGGGHSRHHGGIDHTQALDTANAQLRIDDRRRVAAHATGAARMVHSPALGARIFP
jgi:hypothetical protein